MIMAKALITDYVHPSLIKGLEERGYVVDYDTSTNMENLSAKVHSYELVVINSKIKMYKDMIDRATNLKYICRLGSGLEIIDLEYAKYKNLHVINTPTGNNNAVAEHAMGMLLALSNNLLRADRQVRDKIWKREENRGWELIGKTIGIIGFGHTKEWDFVSRVNLEDILIESDIISLHLPLTEETKNLVNRKFINRCKDKVIILNTSRGKVVNTLDLVEALEEGKVGGACLDVFENEKPHTYSQSEINTYSRLFSMDNVVLSPHIAGWTAESLEKIARVILEKIDMTR